MEIFDDTNNGENDDDDDDHRKYIHLSYAHIAGSKNVHKKFSHLLYSTIQLDITMKS